MMKSDKKKKKLVGSKPLMSAALDGDIKGVKSSKEAKAKLDSDSSKFSDRLKALVAKRTGSKLQDTSSQVKWGNVKSTAKKPVKKGKISVTQSGKTKIVEAKDIAKSVSKGVSVGGTNKLNKKDKKIVTKKVDSMDEKGRVFSFKAKAAKKSIKKKLKKLKKDKKGY